MIASPGAKHWLGIPARTGRTAAIVLLCALGFALLESSRALVLNRMDGRPIPLFLLVLQNLPWWFVWAALVPAVAWMLRRFPLSDATQRVRNLLLHGVAAIILGSVHIWIATPLFFLLARPVSRQGPPLLQLVINWQLGFIVTNIVTYGMILGVLQAVEALRRYDESREQALVLAKQAADFERRMVEARLDALQKELNPHFLFNSLSAISALVRHRDHDSAISMLARLGDMLRVTLDRDLPAELPLEQELELLGHYIALEQARLGDRLTVDIDVPTALRSALVPTLSMQPLVENAVRHGIASVPGAGRISVTAAAVDSQLRVEVRDSGPGFPAERLSAATFGVGLSNTRARLEELYGRSAGLDLQNHANGGAVATMWLPLSTQQ
jgi:two-component system, LytTR family, sensor kinase